MPVPIVGPPRGTLASGETQLDPIYKLYTTNLWPWHAQKDRKGSLPLIEIELRQTDNILEPSVS